MSESLVTPAAHERLDQLELAMLDSGLPAVNLPLVHRFTPGLYIRQIFMPAGTLLTSKIHNTEHPYVVTQGRVAVMIPGVGVEEIEAGHVGITRSGTRRLLYIREDCTWLTFHPLAAEEEAMRVAGASEAELLAALEERIIERRELPDGSTIFDHYQELLAAAGVPVSLEEELSFLPEQAEYMGAP